MAFLISSMNLYTFSPNSPLKGGGKTTVSLLLFSALQLRPRDSSSTDNKLILSLIVSSKVSMIDLICSLASSKSSNGTHSS